MPACGPLAWGGVFVRTRSGAWAIQTARMGGPSPWEKVDAQRPDEADKGMLHSLWSILIWLTNRKRLPFATFPFLGKAQNNTPICAAIP